MITVDTAMRLATMQQRVFACIDDALREDGHHKSYEGAFEVTMHLPNRFAPNTPSWSITLHCYVLALDGRHETWSGRTLEEAVATAENAIEKLCFPYEMKRFSRDMGMCEDTPEEADGSSTIYAAPRDFGPSEPF